MTVLYDNYALALATIYNNGTLRRMVNRANKGFHLREDEFDKVVESFHDPKKRERIRKAFEKLDKYNGQIEKLKKTDKQVNYLCFLIDQSPSVKDIKNGDEFGDYINKFRLWKKSSRDSLIRAGESSVNAASKLFGNSMGMIQFGDGKLYKDKAVEADMRAQLKPLDILLEKTPFRLTDKFIPGHYGHVAIWLGSEAELKRYNLWDHPQIKPYQQKIREGKCVLEALRDGVQLNTLAHFLNVDDIAVLRCRQLNVKMLMPKAFRQIGKEYDFNFDVETIDKIVCSELVYQVFTSMTWPTERTMGRSTISPDNVAVKAQGGGPLELRVLYHDGLKIHKDKQVKFAKLLKGE
ncbi:MAG: Poxvirus G6 [Lentisphaeraceae bacterium]|nr:Poxvirus G6 [Lentisphaeraceae bacterium]